LRNLGEEQGRLSLKRKSRSDNGQSKLPRKTEEIIALILRDLRREDKKVTQIHKVIIEPIELANAQNRVNDGEEANKIQAGSAITSPSLGTVRNRLTQVPPRAIFAPLHGKQVAAQRFDPTLESFPGAGWPLVS
jgi:hypothetical protein